MHLVRIEERLRCRLRRHLRPAHASDHGEERSEEQTAQRWREFSDALVDEVFEAERREAAALFVQRDPLEQAGVQLAVEHGAAR